MEIVHQDVVTSVTIPHHLHVIIKQLILNLHILKNFAVIIIEEYK